jgi:iron complex outermembrane receptor protein
MPPNLRLALTRSGTRWTHAAEFRAVAAKRHVSQVRNEVPTAGYALLDLRTSYEQGPLRIDLSVENAFNRAYAQPLGGAYVGQGASMATTSLPWGVTVPGRGRSLGLTLSVRL